jgi:hypothetical protein
MPRLWLPTRGRAAVVVLGGLVIFVTSAVNDAPAASTDASTITSASPADQLSTRARAIVEASRGTLVSFNITAPGQQRDTIEAEWRAPSGFVAARIWADVRDVLRAIRESGLADGGQIWMKVQLPARDVYGAETTVLGLSLLFDPAELQRVQWESVRPENLAKIASRTIAFHRDLQ